MGFSGTLFKPKYGAKESPQVSIHTILTRDFLISLGNSVYGTLFLWTMQQINIYRLPYDFDLQRAATPFKNAFKYNAIITDALTHYGFV